MDPIRVAFDVDGTLIDDEDNPRWLVIDLLRALHAAGCTIIVWSGGGINYSSHWVQRLGIDPFVSHVVEKGGTPVDIAVDDEVVNLGTVNLQVRRDWP